MRFRSSLLALFTALLALAPQARAQDDSRLKTFVIEDVVNENSKIMVRVDVDHPDRTYYEGEPLVVKLIAEKDCYVYLLDINAQGDVKCLFPNIRQKDNFVKGGVEVAIPGPNETFKLRTRAPFGEDVLFVLATQQPGDQVFQGKNLRAGDVTTLTAKDVRGMKGRLGAFVAEPSWAEHRITVRTVAGPRPTTDPIQVVPSGKRKRVAVVWGINDYQDPVIPDLSLCQQDAQHMADALAAHCGVNEVKLLLGAQATREAIRKAIFEWARDRTRPGDSVIIYYSGHGGRCSDTDGDEPDGEDEYLVPWDGVFARPTETMILDDTFGRWINELQGREVLVILDNCYSGGAAKKLPKGKTTATRLSKAISDGSPEAGVVIGGSGDAARPKGAKAIDPTKIDHFGTEILRAGKVKFSKDLSGTGTVLIAASQADQIAFEMPGGDGSVLTHFLVGTLNDGNDPLTAYTLFNKVKQSVVDYVKAQLSADQIPVLVGEPSSMVVRP